MFTKILTAAIFTASAGIAAATDAFSALDTDNNGVIEKKEASANQALITQWGILDVDSSGDLSVEEFAKYQEALESQEKLSGAS